LVERLGGQLVGDANLEVTDRPLADAGVSHISFLSNSKLRAQALQSKAAALIVSAADDAFIAAGYSGARIVVPNPYVYFARAAQYFESLTAIVPAPGMHASAVVADSAQVAPAPTSARAW
jgi:UDP-3-O-[3-hydroxymyristoyl] glucosamine N-acyltransferase